MQAAFAVALLIAISGYASAAIIHGTVYDADNLEVADKAIVTLSSTPEQTELAENGTYSFDVETGNYTLAVVLYREGSKLVGEETIEIHDNGDYLLDVFLFPKEYLPIRENAPLNGSGARELGLLDRLEQNMSNATVASGSKGTDRQDYLLQFAAGIAILLAMGLVLWKKYGQKKTVQHKATKPAVKAKSAPAQASLPGNSLVLTADQKRAVSILRMNGGHATQKEIRKLMPYSEAKVSLILTELEEMKIVKRFKRGRGNIIKLMEK